MQQITKATLTVKWHPDPTGHVTVGLTLNPADLDFKRSVQIAEIPIPGLDSPLLQFIRGQNETLTLSLFFDTTDKGMGDTATSVATLVDPIYGATKVDPLTHAPPVCTFAWGDDFPGNHIHDKAGSQKRENFECLVERVDHKYTLFSPKGVPLRATATVTLREFKTLGRQLLQLGLNSPDRTQVRTLRTDETLDTIAAEHYRRSGQWRTIARANHIEDPRRLAPGTFLTLPPLD
jgi:Contractile injection system tube protein/LysM domain